MSPDTRRTPGHPGVRSQVARQSTDEANGSSAGLAAWLRWQSPDLERQRQRQADLKVRAFLLGTRRPVSAAPRRWVA